MTIRIRFFSSFCTSKNAADAYISSGDALNHPSYGEGKEFVFVNDDSYTHAILLNTAMPPNLTIPKENVIGLAQEPPPFLGINDRFINFCIKHVGKYFLGDKLNLPDPFVESNAYLFFGRPPKELLPSPKPNIMSIMVSQKQNAPGHKYRHELVQRILQTNLPIDIWGRGCAMYMNKTKNNNGEHDPRLKGNFSDFEPYQSYQFHIAIENFRTNHYFSEKIINPLLWSTFPIYIGCFSVSHYFGTQDQQTGPVIVLSGDPDKDIDLLGNICANPSLYKQPAIDIPRVYETVNLLNNVTRLFRNEKAL